MGSVNQTKKGMSGTLAAVILGIAGFVGQANANQVIVGGQVALINQLLSWGNTELDLSSTQTDAVIANFWIYNNAAQGFDFDLTFANGGEFVKMDSTTATATDGLEWTSAKVVPSGDGTLGTMITALTGGTEDVTLTAPTANATFDWTSGAQSSATTAYQLNLEATWTGTTSLLAGLYVEVITATLVADM